MPPLHPGSQAFASLHHESAATCLGWPTLKSRRQSGTILPPLAARFSFLPAEAAPLEDCSAAQMSPEVSLPLNLRSCRAFVFAEPKNQLNSPLIAPPTPGPPQTG